jgi:putative effector of murein hydrolase LrgA (UPF0299 family)
MLLSLGLILLCQLMGEAIARATDVPIPGPVIGMVLCVLLLLARDRVLRWMPAELRILSHLSMLFIPAGVGVVQRLDVLAGNALAIAVSLLVSTVLSLAVTALVFNFVARRLNA